MSSNRIDEAARRISRKCRATASKRITRLSIPMHTKSCPHRCVFVIYVLNFVPTDLDKFLFCLLKRIYSLSKGKETWLVLSDETRSCLRMDDLAHVFQVFRSNTGNKSLDCIYWT